MAIWNRRWHGQNWVWLFMMLLIIIDTVPSDDANLSRLTKITIAGAICAKFKDHVSRGEIKDHHSVIVGVGDQDVIICSKAKSAGIVKIHVFSDSHEGTQILHCYLTIAMVHCLLTRRTTVDCSSIVFGRP